MKRVFRARIWISIVTLALLVASALAVFGVFRFRWHYGLSTNDKAVIVNTVIAACALILVGWGVIVALAAYVNTTGSPDLRFELSIYSSKPNRPVLKALPELPGPGGSVRVDRSEPRVATIAIENKSKYAARNPGVLIEFQNCGLDNDRVGGWEVISRSIGTGAVTVIQWDGGADYIIHGRWVRILPSLDFESLTRYGDDPKLAVNVAADGFEPRKWVIPIQVLGPAAYDEYIKQEISAGSAESPLPDPPPLRQLHIGTRVALRGSRLPAMRGHHAGPTSGLTLSRRQGVPLRGEDRRTRWPGRHQHACHPLLPPDWLAG